MNMNVYILYLRIVIEVRRVSEIPVGNHDHEQHIFNRGMYPV